MQTENLTRPGEPPQDGDFIQITHPNGFIEKKHYWAPVVEPTVE